MQVAVINNAASAAGCKGCGPARQARAGEFDLIMALAGAGSLPVVAVQGLPAEEKGALSSGSPEIQDLPSVSAGPAAGGAFGQAVLLDLTGGGEIVNSTPAVTTPVQASGEILTDPAGEASKTDPATAPEPAAAPAGDGKQPFAAALLPGTANPPGAWQDSKPAGAGLAAAVSKQTALTREVAQSESGGGPVPPQEGPLDIPSGVPGKERLQMVGENSSLALLKGAGETGRPKAAGLTGQPARGADLQVEAAVTGASQLNQAGPGANPSPQPAVSAFRGVGLPGLGERIAWEIKHFFNNHRGGQQTRLQLKLEPEHLGRLTIRLFFSGAELNAHFYAGNNHVKEVLENSLPQLRELLAQQEVKLEEAQVYTGDGGGWSDPGRSAEDEQTLLYKERTGGPEVRQEQDGAGLMYFRATGVNYLV